jgi:hypothetical protein
VVEMHYGPPPLPSQQVGYIDWHGSLRRVPLSRAGTERAGTRGADSPSLRQQPHSFLFADHWPRMWWNCRLLAKECPLCGTLLSHSET